MTFGFITADMQNRLIFLFGRRCCRQAVKCGKEKNFLLPDRLCSADKHRDQHLKPLIYAEIWRERKRDSSNVTVPNMNT